jgi:hypothetical protein
MTLKEMKIKVLGMIEELNPNHELLTDDPDIATKINGVTNQVMFELARHKKLPGYVEIPVKKGDLIDFTDIERHGKYEVYQISIVRGVNCDYKAQGTIVKALEDGVAEVDYFKYPEAITDKTKDSYEFELTPDVLEVMPYGIAADLLKSDVSTNYGRIYAERYEAMKQLLDPRYSTGGIYIESEVDI